MQPPWSRIPALPAAMGLVAGILSAQAVAAAPYVAAAAAVVAVVLWLWRPLRFFASAPAAMCLGVALACVSPAGAAPEPPEARGAIVRTVHASQLSGPAAAFVTTTLVAEGRMLPQSLREGFRASGLAHILALSGFHVGIVAMIVMWLTRPMLAAGRASRLRAPLVLAAVWAFAALGGMSASVVRAAVMFSLLVGARLAGRYPSPLNALAVAAIVILAWRPAALFDVGFQLSFAAVAGILAFAGPLNPFDRFEHPRLHAIAAAVAVPVGATAATAPIVAYVFGALPLLFLPANILASIVFAPFYVLALLHVALASLGMELVVVVRAVDALYALMARAADILAASVPVEITPAALITAYAALAALCLYLRAKKN